VALGRSLDITTVAEGIETIEQAERMRSLGCTYGQGYLFSRPLAGAQFRSQPTDPTEVGAEVTTEVAAPSEPPARRRRSRPRTLAPNPSAG
jgi:predicted signal transduction protein with EAL and GGDEF domain